ncbi:MAG TPA: tape measure protein, partial [Tepidisphaeraceae bacterium]|nr:tape measure protein [Tepidisphaeraceae bacterium]
SALLHTFLDALKSVTGYAMTAGKVAIAGLVAAMAALGRQGIVTNESLAETSMGLKTLLRSSTAAADMMRALRKEAITSAFEFTDLADYSKRLIGFGFAARSVIPTLRALGDASAGLGGGKGMLDRLVLALGQVKAKGRLQSDELLQFAESGIPALDFVARGIGKTTEETQKLITEGLVPADVAIRAITSGIEQRFGGMQKNFMGTWEGVKSTIRDVINDISSSVTGRLYKSLIRAGQGLADFLSSLQRTRSGQVILGALENTYASIGRAIEGLVGMLPRASQLLADFLQSDKFQTFKVIASNAFEAVKRAAHSAVSWVMGNWGKMWNTAAAATITGVKVIGGGVAGVTAMIRELLTTQANGATNWREMFVQMGEAVKGFTMHAVSGLFSVAKALLNVADTWGWVWAVVSSNDLATMTAKFLAWGTLRWYKQGIQAGLDNAETSIMKRLSGLDFEKMTNGNILAGFADSKGLLGVGARAAMDWNATVDQFVASLTKRPDGKPRNNIAALFDSMPKVSDAVRDIVRPQNPVSGQVANTLAAPMRQAVTAMIPVPQFTGAELANVWASQYRVSRHWNSELSGWVSDSPENYGQF